MRRIVPFILACWVLSLTVLAAHAAHTQAQLILSDTTAKPGDTILAAVHLTMEDGWHTYWRNPGDAGEATEIKWQLPAGVTAGPIQWPLPQKLPPAEVTTYGYEGETVLIVPLTLAKSLPTGPLTIAAKLNWLECKESCIPAGQNVQATLTIGDQTTASDDALLISTWQAKVPKPGTGITAQGFWQPSTNDDTRSLLFQITWTNSALADKHPTADFFPEAYNDFEVLPDIKVVSDLPNELDFTKTVKKFAGDWPKEIAGVLVLPEGSFDIKIPVSSVTPIGGSPAPASTAAAPVSAMPSNGLALNLLFAFIGGLILNLMPCVLPVIALKILGFVSEAGSATGRVRALSLIYTLGVLASFLFLAGIVIAVKATGHQPAWGMQFSSPVFIVCLTTLVTLVALNLFGVFEVILSGKALDTASGLASRGGARGAFFNGVLATTLATPCTAPFLAPALGFAFFQPSPIILLFFLTIGLGLAAPYIVLGWHPAWLKFLPKPGAWMEKFKIAMGFPMLATAVWLLNIAAGSYGKNVLWLGLFLTIVALAAWIFGEFVQRGRSGKTAAAIVVLLLLVGGYAFALEKELDWRHAMPPATAGIVKESANGIEWHPWSPDAVTSAIDAGHPVLVDFTADWCLTCQVNKKTSIEISSVRQKLKDINAVALIADYTHFPDSITAELAKYQRAGVPLVLVYPKAPKAAPIVLPALLTPGIVLDALDQAAK